MAPRKLVDIDNADPADIQNRTFTNSIESHSQIAEFYRYRPPYTGKFFERAVAKLEISKDSTLLDLCCGRGELASGFAETCRLVFAVDGSEKMLEHGIARDNIRYIQHDVNEGTFDLPEMADHLVIGTAIHWVQQKSLQRIIEQNLRPGAKFLVTHRLIRMEAEPYFAPLTKVNAKYGRRPPNVDLWGTEKLRACGYQATDRVHIKRQIRFGIDFLYRNQLSHLYRDFYKNVSANFEQYRNDVHDALTPFVNDDRLTGTLVNWGVIYTPLA